MSLLKDRFLVGALLILLAFQTIGCVRAVRLDSPDYRPSYDSVNLKFKTETLSKSRWYILTAYNLRLVVYGADDTELDKYRYVGTAVLTHDQSNKDLPIPSEKNIYLMTEYSDYVVGVMSSCRTALCFHSKQGETYNLTFNHDSKSCKSILTQGNSDKPIDAVCLFPSKKQNAPDNVGNPMNPVSNQSQ